eukprot:184961-Amphidinium_carterae.2
MQKVPYKEEGVEQAVRRTLTGMTRNEYSRHHPVFDVFQRCADDEFPHTLFACLSATVAALLVSSRGIEKGGTGVSIGHCTRIWQALCGTPLQSI